MAVVAPIPRPSVRMTTAVKPGFRTNVRTAYLKSLIPGLLTCVRSVGPQRHQRVDSEHAPRWNVGSEEREGEQESRHGAIGQRVGRADAEEKARERLARHERAHE